jgi:hypothetical protein
MKLDSLNPQKNTRLPQKVIFVLITGLFCVSLLIPYNVVGQTTDQTWTIPVNLSHSGSTSNPTIVSTPDKRIFVVWQDAYSGSIYSTWDGNQWSKPKGVKFPFDTYKPRLLSNSDGRIYAFWTDNQGNLFRSYVEEPYFGEPSGWSKPHQLSESVSGFDITVDGRNQIHLAYIQTEDTPVAPAGIYFLRTTDTITFTDPIPIYQSPYFRGLGENLANVQVVTTGKGQTSKVYIVWDNPLRKQIFFANSGDGGRTWNDPQMINGPGLALGSNSPFKIRINADDDNILLFWQNGDLITTTTGGGASGTTATGSIGGNCKQYSQSSTDGGKTWSEPQEIFKVLNACVQDYQIFPIMNNLSLLMLTTTLNQVFLVAWDGHSWSSLQAQPTLSGFEDPELFNTVKFGCHQTTQIGNDELIVIGCDLGAGGDIWVTSRNLGQLTDWYPPPSAWNPPTTVTTRQFQTFSPVVISGPVGQLNLLWNQVNETNLNTHSIYLSGLNGEKWSSPIAILSSPEGETGLVTAKLDSNGRLLVTWSGGNTGQIYFSWANASKAVNKSEWAPPQSILTPGEGSTSPDINLDANGRIFIVYDIPLNEHRGIYINQSTDNGNTWSDPVRIFNAASAGWDMVGQPQLVVAADNSLHVFWTKYTLPGGDGPLGVYVAHSEDNGNTWSAPAVMVEGTIKWSQALGTDNGPLQFVWVEQNSGRIVIKHQYSLDFGKTWERTATISNINNFQGNPSAATDTASRLHLIIISQGDNKNLILNHLMWDGQKWITDDSIDISGDSSIDVNSVATDISPAGRLDVVYSGTVNNAINNTPQYNIYYISRSIEIPKTVVLELSPTNPPSEQTPPSITPTPTTTLEPTIPSLTPTPDQPTLVTQLEQNPPSNNNYSGLIIGVGLAILVGILFLGFRLRNLRGRT